MIKPKIQTRTDGFSKEAFRIAREVKESWHRPVPSLFFDPIGVRRNTLLGGSRKNTFGKSKKRNGGNGKKKQKKGSSY